MLDAVGEYYPLFERQGGDGCRLSFRRRENSGRLLVMRQGDSVTVEYDSVSGAARGVGLVMAGRDCDETAVFKTLGIMLDCSRNAVMTVEHFKGWLLRLALMGYNMAMLYTEDTYELPDEPYFGYMRGPYTAEEIRELDDYAKKLGIELVACIQVLGHMEQILQWAAYQPVKDTRNVLLVNEPKTYELIEKMIAFWSRTLSTERIHIGMDETHDLGRGRFMDIYGYERGFDIFNRHLGRVGEICEKYGLRPMIWSDMYFRLGNSRQDYYAPETVIPDDVKRQIPANVDLVYWDYYHREREFYSEWIKRHRELGHEPMMASGIWTWGKLWCDHELTHATVQPCIEACRDSKLAEILFTMWGDDGAYCEFDSSLAELCRAADMAFGEKGTAADIEKSFGTICGGSYHVHQIASQLDYAFWENEKVQASLLLWDDPLMMKYLREISKKLPDGYASIVRHYRSLAESLKPFENQTAGGCIALAFKAATFLADKVELQNGLSTACSVRDIATVKDIAENGIPAIIGALRDFAAVFRRQWLNRNKRFGLDVMQIRFGGQIARWEEMAVTLNEFIAGKIATVPEFDAGKGVAESSAVPGCTWSRLAMSSSSLLW